MSQPIDLAALRAVLKLDMEARFQHSMIRVEELDALLTELEQLRRDLEKSNKHEANAWLEVEQLRAQLATVTQERDNEDSLRQYWQQAASKRAQDQAVLERKLEAVTAELRGQSSGG